VSLRPGLIPTELWEYSAGDVARGISRALGRSDSGEEIVSVPRVGDAVPVRSGRAGVVLALQTLDLRPGSRIGVPLYCCPVVFKAIVAAGHQPRFVDVSPSTFCISPEDLSIKQRDIDALIAVHMFGNVCDVPALQAVMPGMPIVEDCAQSIGSTLRGEPTGRLGDVAVFSFRSGKYLSVGEGGAVFASREALRQRAARLVADLPRIGRAEEMTHVAKSYLRSKLRSRPLYGLAGHAIWETYNRSVSYTSKSPLVVGRAFRSDVALTRDRLADLDRAIEVRRAHADVFARIWERQPITLSREAPATFYNRYQFPLLFPTAAVRDAVAAALMARGIDTAKPYSDIAGVAAAHYGYAGDCRASEQIAQRVLVVPNHEQLSRDDVQRIAYGLATALRDAPQLTATAPPVMTRA